MKRHIATRKCRIDGKKFLAGQTIKGIPERRVLGLVGRLVREATKDDPEDGEILPGKPAADGDEDGDLSGMTVKQLRAMADELDIEIPKDTQKADIVAIIQDATK